MEREMKTVRHNLRGVNFFLALTLILVASASGAAWECLDGTPCSMHHPMPLQAAAQAHPDPVNIQPHCSHCPEEKQAVRAQAAVQRNLTAPHCVLRQSAAPSAVLQKSQVVLASP